MYIRFLKKFRYHKINDILNTTYGAGDFLVQKKIAEEMVKDIFNNDKLITVKEYDIMEDKRIADMDKKFKEQREKKEQEQQDLIDIEDILEEQETPKRKRGRPRKSPNNKMTNTNTLITK